MLSSHHRFKSRHERFEFPQHAFSSKGALVAAATADEKHVSKHFTETFKRPAHGRLTQETSLCSARHMAFFE
jgi:hypothetical protein